MNEYAVIDIGSNTVRYMGADGNKRLVTTRLAQGLTQSGVLGEEAMRRSVEAVCAFVALSREEGLTTRAYATSAVRDAKNAHVFLDMLKSACSLAVDVLSGEREARYALLGAGDACGALIDIGGGSSQIIAGDFQASFPMGCVRAKEICAGADTLDEMRQRLYERCDDIYRFPRLSVLSWTGVGGTITTLAALSLGLAQYDKQAVSSCTLTIDGAEELTRLLHGMGEARKEHPLLFERHDVIVPGALILLYIMRGIGITKLHVSDADGMEGYLTYLRSLYC